MKLAPIIFIWAFFLASCSPTKKTEPYSPEPISEENLLINVRSTDRISSNHYSDFVLDKAGNSYIASFQKQQGAFDRILILKLSPTGKILWEIGKNNQGRALAIAKSTTGDLWVCGRFTGKLSWNGQELTAGESNHMFLAKITPDGICTQLIKPQGSILAFNIEVSASGQIMLGGVMGNEGGFGNIQANKSTTETSFLALFDQAGNCTWIKRLWGNIQRIKSDDENNFYIGGDFVGKFSFGQDSSFTQGNFDQDGFLIKVGPEDSWSKTFGYKGFLKYGYRSYEGISDLSVNDSHHIHAVLRIDNPIEAKKENSSEQIFPTDLLLLSLTQTGKIRDSLPVVKHIQKGHIFRMTQDSLKRIWIAGTGKGNFRIGTEPYTSPSNQSFLLRISKEKQIEEIVMPDHGPNMLFRVLNPLGSHVVISGHYQSHLYIGKDSIENDGKHGMFLFRTTGE